MNRETATAIAWAFTAGMTVTNPAYGAEPWFILDMRTQECVPAPTISKRYKLPEFDSPYLLEDSLRSVGRLDRIDEVRDEDGAVTAVGVFNRQGIVVLYFAGQERCQIGRQSSITRGVFRDRHST